MTWIDPEARTGLGVVRSAQAAWIQALGRLPWFALFFLRARRLRPVFPMVCPFACVLVGPIVSAKRERS